MRFILCLAVFASAWWVFTWDNDFPYYYHPDEPSKVRQVQKEFRNFHHPLLLLNATQWVVSLTTPENSQELEAQRIAVVGRQVAAGFGAVAVTALVALGWSLGGARVGLMLWLLLVLHEQFFELSHYFKEDTSLLAGLALSFLTLLRYERRPGWVASGLVGVASALAVSGKYVGILGLIICFGALAWIAFRRDGGVRKNWKDLAVAILFCLLTLMAVNWQLLAESGRADFTAGLSRETDFALAGHKGTTRNVPHLAYTASFSRNTNVVLWAFMVAHGVWLIRNRRRVSTSHWAVVSYVLLYVVILSFSPKVSDRYFFPATGFFLLLSALGAKNLADWISGNSRVLRRCPVAADVRLIFALLALGGFLPMLPDFIAYARAFHEDDRKALLAYIVNNLPPSAKIAQDGRVHIPGDPKEKFQTAHAGSIPQTIQSATFAPDIGTLDELIANGFTHVAVCKGDYGRFFRDKIRPRDGAEEEFARRWQFYNTLFSRGELVWEREPGDLLTLQPGLRLYSLERLAHQ